MTLYAKKLRKNFSVPLYYQLKQLLLKEIQSGAYDENIPLPPEVELAKQFQISRPTVRQAIGSLVSEGILKRTKGKGTYVIPSPNAKQAFIHKMNACSNEILSEGTLPETKVLSLKKIPIDPAIASHLEVTSDSHVVELIRLRFTEGEPSVLITSYIPAEVGAGFLDRDFSKESLYQTFDKLNVPVKKVKRVFEVKMPSADERTLLGIPTDVPLFDFTTTAYTTGQIPVEYSFTKYRGDRNKFFIELSK